MSTPATPRIPRLLLIGGKDSGFRSTSALDVDITLLQAAEDLTDLQTKRASQLFVCEALAEVGAAEVAAALHGADPFDAVLSFDERRLELAARLGERLAIAHNPRGAVEQTRDKLAMRRAAQAHGLPTVRFAECAEPADAHAFLASLSPGAGAVLKPSRGSGSRGVASVRRPADIDASWERCIDAEGLPAIIEEYVDGAEYSVETITLDGVHRVVAITEKLTTGAPAFVEVGHQLPARLQADAARAMEQTVLGLLDAVGHRWGPGHTEVMLSPTRGPVVIESHTRFGGDQIWEMVELVTGVRLAGATVAGLLGATGPVSSPPIAAAAAIRYFAHEHATVSGVSGVERAGALPGVVRVQLDIEPGAVLGPLRGSRGRQGYVIAVGDDVEQAVARAEQARATVVFDLRRHAPDGSEGQP
jgi:biotin carboxylase